MYDSKIDYDPGPSITLPGRAMDLVPYAPPIPVVDRLVELRGLNGTVVYRIAE